MRADPEQGEDTFHGSGMPGMLAKGVTHDRGLFSNSGALNVFAED